MYQIAYLPPSLPCVRACESACVALVHVLHHGGDAPALPRRIGPDLRCSDRASEALRCAGEHPLGGSRGEPAPRAEAGRPPCRSAAVVSRAGELDEEEGAPLTEAAVSRWQPQFLRQKIMAVMFLGPRQGFLELQPYDEEEIFQGIVLLKAGNPKSHPSLPRSLCCAHGPSRRPLSQISKDRMPEDMETCQVRTVPGMIVLLRADKMSHKHAVPIEDQNEIAQLRLASSTGVHRLESRHSTDDVNASGSLRWISERPHKSVAEPLIFR